MGKLSAVLAKLSSFSKAGKPKKVKRSDGAAEREPSQQERPGQGASSQASNARVTTTGTGSGLKVASLLRAGSSRVGQNLGNLPLVHALDLACAFDNSKEPVAVLVFKPDQAAEMSATSLRRSQLGSAAAAGAVHHDSVLECWYANEAAVAFTGCKDMQAFKRDYVQHQLHQQPVFSIMLEHISRRSMAEKQMHASSMFLARQASGVAEEPPLDGASFMNVEVAACVAARDPCGPPQPGLFIHYRPADKDPKLLKTLGYDNACMSHVPCLTTVFSLEGQVLHQNASSIAYMGHAMDEDLTQYGIHEPEHPIRRLFSLDNDNFDEMWTSLQSGEDWRGRVRMPASATLVSGLNSSRKTNVTHTATSGCAIPTNAEAAWPSECARYLDAPTALSKKESMRSRKSSIVNCISGTCLFPAETVDAAAESPPQGTPKASQSSAIESMTESLGPALTGASSALLAPTASISSQPSGLCPIMHQAVSLFDDRLESLIEEEESSAWAISAATVFDTGNDGDDGNSPEQPNPFKITTQPSKDSRSFNLSNRPRNYNQECNQPGAWLMCSCPDMSAGAPPGPGSSTHMQSYGSKTSGTYTLARRISVRRSSTVSFQMSTELTAATRALRMVTAKRSTSQGSFSAVSTSGPGDCVPSSNGGAKDADSWFDVYAAKITDPSTGQPGYLLVQTDVTGAVDAEQDMQRILDAEHALLEQVFPRHVLEVMAVDRAEAHRQGTTTQLMAPQNAESLARSHKAVTIMFADIVTYTDMCRQIEPQVVMRFLNKLFTQLDDLVERYGVYKVETVGDCYIVAGGLVQANAEGCYEALNEDCVDPEHGRKVLAFANAMLNVAAGVMLPTTGTPVQIRVGIHSGPIVSGIIGRKMPRFGLFGDSMNTASRMESTSQPNRIHVSAAAMEAIGSNPPGGVWAPTGGVQVKGKGLMETYFYEPGPSSEIIASGTMFAGTL